MWKLYVQCKRISYFIIYIKTTIRMSTFSCCCCCRNLVVVERSDSICSKTRKVESAPLQVLKWARIAYVFNLDIISGDCRYQHFGNRCRWDHAELLANWSIGNNWLDLLTIFVVAVWVSESLSGNLARLPDLDIVLERPMCADLIAAEREIVPSVYLLEASLDCLTRLSK